MYQSLMAGGGYLSVDRSLAADAEGGIVPLLDTAVHLIEAETRALEINPQARVQVERLWWETLHAEPALDILASKVDSLGKAQQYFARGKPARFATAQLASHLDQWRTGYDTKRMRRRTVVGQIERDVAKFEPRVAAKNVLEDTDWVEIDPADQRTWAINGQAIAIEMVMSLLAARVGVHVPIACCGSDLEKTCFWILQCDYERTLDEMLSETWCKPRGLLIDPKDQSIADKIEKTVLAHSVRMVRLLSRMGILVLQLDPRKNISSSVSSSRPVQATVALNDMRADYCQLVDLGDEFCQWYMECFLLVALGGPLRIEGAARPLSPVSLEFMYELLGSSPGDPTFDVTVETNALTSELRKWWLAANLSLKAETTADPLAGKEPAAADTWEPDLSSVATFETSKKEHEALVKANDDKPLPLGGAVPPWQRMSVEAVQAVVNEIAPGAVALPAEPLHANKDAAVPDSSQAGLMDDVKNGVRLTFLQEVQQGRTLKKAPPPPPKLTLADQNKKGKPVRPLIFIEEIKRGKTLKKVDPQKPSSKAVEVPKEAEKDIGKILMSSLIGIRAIVAGNSDGEESDSEFSDTDSKYGQFPAVFFRSPSRRHGVATDGNAASAGAGISADSQKFAKTMHERVLDLAVNFATYWYPPDAERTLSESVSLAAGKQAGDVQDVLQLLSAMTSETVALTKIRFYKADIGVKQFKNDGEEAAAKGVVVAGEI